MTRPLLALLLLAAPAQAQDTLRVPLAAVPGPGPFAVPVGSAQSVEGVDLGPTGLPDALGARVYDEPVWVPGTDGFALVTWAVAEAADGAVTVWVDADGDRDLAEEASRTYPPLAAAHGADPRRAAAEANETVAADTLTVRHGGRETRVTFWPFLYAVDEAGAPLRHADGARRVFVQVARHHRGRLALGGAAFDVVLGGDAPGRAPYGATDARIWVVPAGAAPGGAPHPWGEPFPVGGRMVRLAGVAEDASSLDLAVDEPAPEAPER